MLHLYLVSFLETLSTRSNWFRKAIGERTWLWGRAPYLGSVHSKWPTGPSRLEKKSFYQEVKLSFAGYCDEQEHFFMAEMLKFDILITCSAYLAGTVIGLCGQGLIL